MADDDYSNAKTSVWWDIENCNVPKTVDPYTIAQNISSALSKLDYKGPVSITAYGDTKFLSPRVQNALSSTGIALNHVPSGVKDASDKKILVDMLFWAVDNPAPANYLLISGDRDFSNALHRLRMRRYNILLARPTQNVSASLTGAAKSVWLWTNLARGEPALQNSVSDVEQIVQKSDSNSTVNSAKTEPLEMKHSSSEPSLKCPVSQGLPSCPKPSMPGMQTKHVNKHCLESGFQEARQFLMNWSDPMRTVQCTNGQEQPGNLNCFPGAKGPAVTSEVPPLSHANSLGNSNDMRPLSSPQPFINVRPEYSLENFNDMRPLSSSQSFPNGRPEYLLGNSNDMRPLSSRPPFMNVRPNYPLGNSDDTRPLSSPPPFMNVRPDYPLGNFNDTRPLSSSQSFPNARPEYPLGNSNDMRPLSSPQYGMNVRHEYDSIKQAPDPRTFFKLSTKSSSFPASPGKICMSAGNQFQIRARPPFVPNPGPAHHPQMTSNLSIDNLPVARSSFPFDLRSGDSQQNYCNMQDRYSCSSQTLQQIPSEQNSSFSNISAQKEHSMGAVHMPPTRWLLPPEHTGPNLLDSPKIQKNIVLQAIETLRQNMMVPTEENIEDCIRYGEPQIRNFNVRESLEKAIEQNDIVVMSAGGNFQMYLPRNVPLWKCTDPCNMHDTYPKKAWEEFHKFLSSFEGHEAMMSSQRRYHAALILKSTCLHNLVLGEIVHMLQLAISIKRWLRPHHSGWQPLSVTLLGPPQA